MYFFNWLIIRQMLWIFISRIPQIDAEVSVKLAISDLDSCG